MAKNWIKKIAICLAALLLLTISGCENGDVEKYKAKLYFLNNEGTRLEIEEREILMPKADGSLANLVLTELIKGPTRADLKQVIPAETAILKINVEENTAIVDFNSAFTFDQEIDSIFARTAVVSTLCEIPGIEKVKILVDGKDFCATDGTVVRTMSMDDIVYDSQLVVADYKYVKLYFANKNADGLVAEGRTVTINSKESLEYVLLNELIKGPQAEYAYKTVPEETKILSVETKEGTCFVNLSQEFKTKHWGGSSGETMTIYSIVNTLTELDTVQKVQFLIEGQKVEVFIHYIFNEPFERDAKLITKE